MWQACTSPGLAAKISWGRLFVAAGRKATTRPRLEAQRKPEIFRNFSSTYVGESSPLLFDNQTPETLMFGQFQARIRGKDRHRGGARFSHQLRIAFEISNPKSRQTALRRAEQIARATHIPIRFCNFKTVARFFQHGELRVRFGRFVRAQQNAVRLVFAAANASAELMKLSQTKALGCFDQHDGGLW